MFAKHKAFQNLPAHLHAKVHWATLRSSRLYLGCVGFYLLWFVFSFTLIFLDQHSFVLWIANLVVVISMFPFQQITLNRRLAAALLKLNIRPSYCGYCEYDLRATEADTCPECGCKLAPQRKGK
jgi:hypothetical protein